MTTSDKTDPSRVRDIHALTTLSPVRPECLGRLRRRLAVVSWTPGFGRPLLQLATIHYARWSVLGWLPAPDGRGGRWRLNSHYVLFDAGYDGDEQEYLDTFSDVVPLRLSELYRNCFGFAEHVEAVPHAPDRIFSPAAFRRFVDRNRLEPLGSAAADATLSVNAVRQAIAMERTEARGFRQRGSALGHTQHVLEGLALAPPPAQPGLRDSIVDPFWRRLRGDYGVNPLTVIAPLRPDAAPAPDAAATPDSAPLARLRDTHFARLSLIRRSMQDHLGQPRPDRLETDYLLFTADHDGPQEAFLKTLRATAADAIFGDCAAYPRAGDRWEVEEWLRRHVMPTHYYLAGYPPRRVKEVSRLVRARGQLADWTLQRAGRVAGGGD